MPDSHRLPRFHGPGATLQTGCDCQWGAISTLPGVPHLASIARTIFDRPGPFILMTLALTIIALAIDQQVDLTGQRLLGLVAWAILAVSMIYLSPLERTRVGVVIVVATFGEVVGSIIWGAYDYRLGNLPWFVPPGHGLVYLTGLRISQLGAVRRRGDLFVGLALTFLAGWALWGLFLAERRDVAGAIAAAFLAYFLLRGRARTLYAGVFVFVAFLELYGTWIGTWTWAEHLPGSRIPDGNPPSGIAAGYVLFDIAAITFAPALLAWYYRRRGTSP